MINRLIIPIIYLVFVNTYQGRNGARNFHGVPLRKVERKEAGESSRENDQPVIVDGDTHTLTITLQERGTTSTSSKEEKFNKLKEAQAKVQLGTTPKISQVLC